MRWRQSTRFRLPFRCSLTPRTPSPVQGFPWEEADGRAVDWAMAALGREHGWDSEEVIEVRRKCVLEGHQGQGAWLGGEEVLEVWACWGKAGKGGKGLW